MSRIQGTNVIAPIRPFDTNDTYPTAYASEIKGGFKSVDSKNDLYHIPHDRRELGMGVYVKEDKKIYILQHNPTDEITSELDWIAYQVSLEDIKKTPVPHNEDSYPANQQLPEEKKLNLDTKIDTAYNLSVSRHMTFVIEPVVQGPSKIELVCPFDCVLHQYYMAIPENTDIHYPFTAKVEVFGNNPLKPSEPSNWRTVAESTITPNNLKFMNSTKLYELYNINDPLVHSLVQKSYIAAGSKVRVNITSVNELIPSLTYVLSLRELDKDALFPPALR